MLRSWVVELDHDDLTGLDPAKLVGLLEGCRRARADLAVIAADIEAELVEQLGRGRHELAGNVAVEVKGSPRRTGWEHDELWRRVLAAGLDERAVDLETGEIEREADALLRAVRECVGPSWKVTGLRDRGIDPDEFCETRPGWSVRVWTSEQDGETDG